MRVWTDGLPVADLPNRSSSGHHAADYIRRLIFDGVLQTGDRVPQDQVAQALGISRIPVREAVIVLEREGWVTVELHRGAFINSISDTTVRDHYELYGLIYGFAAGRALSRGSADFPDRLQEIAAGVNRSDDLRQIGGLSIDFHRTVLEEAHNRRIGTLVRGLSILVPGPFFVEVPAAVGVQKKGLTAIARALVAGDEQRANAEYLKVMRNVGEKVVDLFSARGLFG
jgi:DNA-binding GntR family transcriptional regulator